MFNIWQYEQWQYPRTLIDLKLSVNRGFARCWFVFCHPKWTFVRHHMDLQVIENKTVLRFEGMEKSVWHNTIKIPSSSPYLNLITLQCMWAPPNLVTCLLNAICCAISMGDMSYRSQMTPWVTANYHLLPFASSVKDMLLNQSGTGKLWYARSMRNMQGEKDRTNSLTSSTTAR